MLCTLRQFFTLIALYLSHVVGAYRHVVLQAEVVEHSSHRHRLCFLEQSQTLESLVGSLILTQLLYRLKQCGEQAALCGTHSDDVSTYAVDGCIELVETHMSTMECIGAD